MNERPRDRRGRFTRPRHRADPPTDRREPSRARHLHAWDQPAELRGCPSCAPLIYSERAARHRADRLADGTLIRDHQGHGCSVDTSPPDDMTRHPPMTW